MKSLVRRNKKGIWRDGVPDFHKILVMLSRSRHTSPNLVYPTTVSPGSGLPNFLTYRRVTSRSCSSAYLRTMNSLLELGFSAFVLGVGRPWMFENDEADEGAGEGRLAPAGAGKKPPGPGDSIFRCFSFAR